MLNIEEIFTVKNIVIYLISINIVTFLAMFIDKKRAEKGEWRIKESTLFMLVLLGGGIGGIAGMYTFRHKTQKMQFVIGFPAILIIEIICIIIFLINK